MKFRHLFLGFTLFLIAISITPTQTNAQTALPSTEQSFIDLSVTPRNPLPNQQIKLTAESFIENLNYDNIEWRANGQVIQSGVGKTEATTNAPDKGQTLTVSIRVSLKNGQVVNKSITIRPSSIDVLWQPLTSVPPFYKGLPLFSHQSSIMFVAVPSFGDPRLPGFGITYKWSVNGEVNPENSGYGKNSFIFNDSILSKEEFIKVSATDSQGNYAEKSFSIRAGGEKVLTYLNSPLVGVLYNNALMDKVTLPSKEFTLLASPYFFSNPSSPVTWLVNGQRVQGYDNNNLLLQNGGGEGEAFVKVSINDPVKFLQNAENSINLVFKE